MWLRWNPSPRPNFNPELLQDLDRYCQFMTHSGGAIEWHGQHGVVDAQLDQLVVAPGTVGLRLDPLGLRRFRRPDHQHGLGVA